MNRISPYLIALAATLAFAVVPATAGAQPAQQQEQIYGSQLMTPQERNAYRERMRNAQTEQERQRLRLEHHEQMQARARERGVTLPDQPPAGGGYGPGPGYGPGYGPGPGGSAGGGRGR